MQVKARIDAQILLMRLRDGTLQTAVILQTPRQATVPRGTKLCVPFYDKDSSIWVSASPHDGSRSVSSTARTAC